MRLLRGVRFSTSGLLRVAATGMGDRGPSSAADAPAARRHRRKGPGVNRPAQPVHMRRIAGFGSAHGGLHA
ncbi:hypothetical protein GCM10010289_01840 [Streptomyces violascens]|uniref:Uncharacterized protein n=1 Tax=Streptomyces violascens TaxID=67381 RepID=A0ABQ3QEY7_9ACTN|nr:hypothetical protein GCM10010289_01840 [Streptomyces violascens]GHI35849.1 hypothetical protein Sviol_02570 [Streptomyces violascens]